jgi:hypothetical protein
MRRRPLALVLALTVALAGCRSKDRAAGDPGGVTLDDNARALVAQLAELESHKDVTCWTSFRQLDWFIAEKSYSEFGTLAKIAAIKGLVRGAWGKASAAATGPRVTAADLAAAVTLPEVALPAEQKGKLAAFANDVGLQNFTDYQKTAEHLRVVLAVVQDEIYRGGAEALKPLDDAALGKLADAATTLSLLLLKESSAAATTARAGVIEGEHVQTAYGKLVADLGLSNPPRKASPLAADAVAARLQPLTRALVQEKIRALASFNKTTGDLTVDLNKVTRIPLSKDAVDHLMKMVQSFGIFITSGVEPMQADNYLSDGSFAKTSFVRVPYLDEVQAQNAVMEIFPHHILENGDVMVRFEPNPGPVAKKPRQPFELRLLDHEMNGVRDSAAHWIALDNVFAAKPYAMDPFAAEYLSEVNSMMLTMFIRRGEEIAREMGKTEIDLEVAKRVQDPSMVLVPPVQASVAAWTPERQARKDQVLAATGPALFRDVTGPAGLPTRFPQFEAAGLEAVEAHVEPPTKDLKGHVEPSPPTKDLKGHVEPSPSTKDMKGHVEPSTKQMTGHTDPPTDGMAAHVAPELTSVQGHFNLQKIMGGGVAVGDVDGDGYPDLFLAGEALGKLYLNRGKAAPGRFVDATARYGIPADLGDSHGVLFFDLEGDGDLDLLVLRSEHPSMILVQDGGKFVDRAAELGFTPHRGAHVATAFDFDRDGDLDLYVGYYGNHQSNTGQSRERSLPSLDGKNGSPNQLWRQEADGRFVEVAAKVGVADPGWALAIVAFDYEMDGDDDLFVANDFGANVLLRNNGDGTFTDVTEATRTGDRGSGMNADVADVNRDGLWDLYLTNIDMFSKRVKVIYPRDESTIRIDESLARAWQYLSGNKLYVSTGKPELPYAAEEGLRFEPGDRGWGWDAAFFDYDNDGDDDMYMLNGWIDGSYAGNQKNQMFINDDGFFYLAPPGSPEAFAGNSRAAAAVDLDLDGDVDLVINNFRQPPRILENVQKRGNRWIKLAVAGEGKNSQAVGALVTIRLPDGTTVLRHVVTGRGYLGQADPILTAGLGKATAVDVDVRWPSGKTRRFTGLAAGKLHKLVQ